MVSAGDCAETLPVVPRGTVPSILDATLQNAPFWRNVEQLRLKENMRLRRPGISKAEQEDIRRSAEWLTSVGRGTCSDRDGFVKIPPYIRVYDPNDGVRALTALLAGKNTDVSAVNVEMLGKLPGEIHIFRSADCVPRSELPSYNGMQVTTEYLNAVPRIAIARDRAQGRGTHCENTESRSCQRWRFMRLKRTVRSSRRVSDFSAGI